MMEAGATIKFSTLSSVTEMDRGVHVRVRARAQRLRSRAGLDDGGHDLWERA